MFVFETPRTARLVAHPPLPDKFNAYTRAKACACTLMFELSWRGYSQDVGAIVHISSFVPDISS